MPIIPETIIPLPGVRVCHTSTVVNKNAINMIVIVEKNCLNRFLQRKKVNPLRGGLGWGDADSIPLVFFV